MAHRPLIGVTAFLHRVDDTFDADICGVRTPEAVAGVAGCAPIVLPGRPEALPTGHLMELLDGLVLTGGRPNVHPRHYGEADDGRYGKFDEGRTAITLPLIRAMVAAGRPVFGICLGIQEMNVAFGGSLHPEIRDEPGRMNHRMPPGEKDPEVIFRRRHLVRFREGGAFARLLGTQETVTNSLHGQAIWRLGERVVAEGRAEDDTIEAISIAGASSFALGVQWHAEYAAGEDPVSRALFTAFGAAARAAQAARNG
ncbi:gamma-glutamyl-gamma-aminobutyrate hydrolase family protein [Paralimibaculum aggregatum]|uniref:Gamma-glutamyl-gamma-aminobutyrate hydrolase family protein n=1 Tax=Paralimibaculum aggregatum TaxID=3036245 RepID=A0ABQ6LCL0_9RHOB|nr:gamma-glutamyl-gamma-aminobutyrate hydrolase family protein [Limibaculum sp. NKW23]GMG81107.1 gamma-glutamyl-gamma-aminobutyrate hydrolase family protein [Limibaculum sp. NKW23]